MPRPCKRRRVCAEPSCGHFGPKGPGAATGQTVIMTLDEFEAIRLAPCTPVEATSPQAYRPASDVRPCRSVRTPPTW